MAEAQYRRPDRIKSMRKIAKEHGVPFSSLQSRIGGKPLLAVDLRKRKMRTDKGYQQGRRSLGRLEFANRSVGVATSLSTALVHGNRTLIKKEHKARSGLFN